MKPTTLKAPLAVILGLLLSGLTGLAQEPSAKGPDTKSPDKGDIPAAEADPLSADQQQVAERFSKLQELFLRSAELESAENPSRSALLQQAAQLGKQAQLADLLARAATSLDKKQYSQALEDQKASRENLKRLLELLQSENRGERVREQRDQVRRWIEETDRLLRLQKSLSGRTEGGQEMQQAAGDQDKLANKAQEIAKELQGSKESPDTKATDGKNDTEGNTPKDKPKEGQSDPDAKDEPKDANSEANGQDKQNNDKSDRDKQDDSNKKDPSKEDDPSKQDGQGQQDKPKDMPQGDDSGKEGQPKDGNPKEGQPSDKSDSKDKSKDGQPPSDSKPSDSKPSDSKPNDSKPNESQPSDPSEGDSQPGASQPEEQPEPKDPTERAKKRIEKAQRKMEEAKKALEEAEREGAVEKQRQAEEELRSAIEALEEILRQLREEEIERSLASLETRLRRMLEMQNKVYEETVRLQEITGEQATRQVEIRSSNLAQEESKILAEGERAFLLLREEGSSAAFPEAMEQVNIDLANVADRLRKADISKLTTSIEQEIISSLEEMVAALVQVQKDQKEKKKKKQQGAQQQQGEAGEQPLVDKLAELRLIRTLQLRINNRTNSLSQMLSDPADVVGQATETDLLNEIKGLAERQANIRQVARDIVVGADE